MKKGEQLIKFVILVKEGTVKKTGGVFGNEAQYLFNLLSKEGIEVKEIEMRSAEVVKRSAYLEINESGNGVSVHLKGWRK